MNDNLFAQLDFGAFTEYIEDDDITDISYTNNGQIWIRSLTQGSKRVENPNINNSVVEKLAFQCSNVMGTTFNNASPFLDAESPELRMNFVHESIATNGIALVIRKTPAKIRLKEETLLEEDYVTKDIHDFLIKCVHGHCNIIVCGETGSGKTEFTKYLASHTVESEKIITIEDTLELHLDKIYPHRDIVAMKTNNIASYSDVLVTCMRQNPKWILLSEVRSAEAVSAVRNSISSGHNILSTIHSDKASAIPHRMYSLMETDLDVDQFLNTIYRYVQMGVHIKAYYSQKYKKFHREIDEITEFYIDEDNKPVYNIIYQKTMSGKVVKKNPSQHLLDYLAAQNIDVGDTTFDNSNDHGMSLEEVVGEKSEEEVLREEAEKQKARMESERENAESNNETDGSTNVSNPVTMDSSSSFVEGKTPEVTIEPTAFGPGTIPQTTTNSEPSGVLSSSVPNSGFSGVNTVFPSPSNSERSNVEPGIVRQENVSMTPGSNIVTPEVAVSGSGPITPVVNQPVVPPVVTPVQVVPEQVPGSNFQTVAPIPNVTSSVVTNPSNPNGGIPVVDIPLVTPWENNS